MRENEGGVGKMVAEHVMRRIGEVSGNIGRRSRVSLGKLEERK